MIHSRGMDSIITRGMVEIAGALLHTGVQHEEAKKTR